MIWKAIPIQYRLLIIAGAAVALATLFFALGRGYSDNVWAAKWEARESELLSAHNQAITKARKAEQDAATALNNIDEAYQNGYENARKDMDRTIADLRSGNLRLRRDLAKAVCVSSDQGAGSREGEAATRLLREAGERVIRIGREADAVVRQLTACQAVVDVCERLGDER